MPPFPVVLEKSSPKTIEVTLAPTHNILQSMMLLAKDEEPGIHEWITRTRAGMTKKELDDHKLALIGFYYAIFPEEGGTTFPAYLNQLEKTEATALRDRMLDSYAGLWQEKKPEVDWEKVLASPEDYMDFLRTRFDDEHVIVEIETKAYELVIDPPAMKEFLVGHMTRVWEKHFAAEWKRVEPMLKESVRSFRRIDLEGMSRIEAASHVTGQDASDASWCAKLDMAERVVFIPNAHMGPYVHAALVNNTLQVVFGARQPEGNIERIPELDRAEIVARFSALADDTRLHILQLVAEKGEIRVQDIMDATGLSQPSVSRYLTQLTATGYLQERRESGAKVYALNQERIEKNLKAVRAFLLGS